MKPAAEWQWNVVLSQDPRTTAQLVTLVTSVGNSIHQVTVDPDTAAKIGNALMTAAEKAGRKILLPSHQDKGLFA